jgi:hypothetical protein
MEIAPTWPRQNKKQSNDLLRALQHAMFCKIALNSFLGRPGGIFYFKVVKSSNGVAYNKTTVSKKMGEIAYNKLITNLLQPRPFNSPGLHGCNTKGPILAGFYLKITVFRQFLYVFCIQLPDFTHPARQCNSGGRANACKNKAYNFMFRNASNKIMKTTPKGFPYPFGVNTKTTIAHNSLKHASFLHHKKLNTFT